MQAISEGKTFVFKGRLVGWSFFCGCLPLVFTIIISPKRKMLAILKCAGPMNAIKFELGI